MYTFSEKLKEKVIKECFEDICESAQKEESGALKGILNTVMKADLYLDLEKSIVVTAKKSNLTINYTYKLSNSKKRVQIVQKLDEPYIFEISFNGEMLTLECEQYSCRCLD